MFLQDVKELANKKLDLEKVKNDLIIGFKNLIENNEDIKEEFDKTHGNENYHLFFNGLIIYLTETRKPFYRARVEIITNQSKRMLAWYEIEYGWSGEILDDYFDFA